MHGANQANCMERYRRQTISNMERKREGQPEEEPYVRGRADRKVVLEYSSDESPDEKNPQPAEGAEAPKRVKKRIHLTLPTSPAPRHYYRNLCHLFH